MTETIINLTELEMPSLVDEQLQKFTMESIHAHPLQKFDAPAAAETLKNMGSTRVLAADFGGDKGVIKLFTLEGGKLVPDPAYDDYVQGDKGAGYLESLERVAAFAGKENIPVGISWGAPLDGTKPLTHEKAAVFMEGLDAKYGGDFANLLPTLQSCINDGPAGLITGAIEVNRTNHVENIIFPINGGGLGMAVLTNNTIYSTEAGHVQGVPALNTYGQTDVCGVFEATYTCIEQLGANKAGIEAQWQAATGSYMRARDIEDRYKEGDTLARDLYDHSALVVAHMIAGTAEAFNIDLYSPSTAVVGHGGAFHFPSYGERIQQILGHNGQQIQLVLTKSFGPVGSNACLDGAAYSALLATAQ